MKIWGLPSELVGNFGSRTGRAAARGFSPAAAARHSKSRIPSGGFAHFYGSWVFHMMFYSLFPSPYKCVDDAPFHPKKHAFLKNLLKNSSTTHY